MVYSYLSGKIVAFLQSHAENTMEQHRIIVYFLHVVLVFSTTLLQFLGLLSSSDPLPMAMSATHVVACLVSLHLYLSRRLSPSAAFTLVALVAQATIIVRTIYFATEQPEHYLQFILLNQFIALLAVIFLVMCFVKYTPAVVAILSMMTYSFTAAYLDEPVLWRTFAFFLCIHFFLCLLGELLRRNVLRIQKENARYQARETAFMKLVRLNEVQIKGYMQMCRNDDPSTEEVDHMFNLLNHRSKRNLIHAVRLHLINSVMKEKDISELFPELTKTEIQVVHLILRGKKRGEICLTLNKTEKNIDVVRTHIRKKLGVPSHQELKHYIEEFLIRKGYMTASVDRL